MDEDGEELDEVDANSIDVPKGEIEFKNVTFSYNPDEPILKGISFTADPGSTTAFVGHTGAGKTNNH